MITHMVTYVNRECHKVHHPHTTPLSTCDEIHQPEVDPVLDDPCISTDEDEIMREIGVHLPERVQTEVSKYYRMYVYMYVIKEIIHACTPIEV